MVEAIRKCIGSSVGNEMMIRCRFFLFLFFWRRVFCNLDTLPITRVTILVLHGQCTVFGYAWSLHTRLVRLV